MGGNDALGHLRASEAIMRTKTVKCILCAGVLVVSPATAAGQQQIPPADSIVRALADYFASPVTPFDARKNRALSILFGAERVPEQTLMQVLDGVTDLALRDPSQRVRVGALVSLGTAGSRTAARPLTTGVVERLTRIRETSTDLNIRRAAIDQLGRQANTAAAAAVLEKIAMEPGEPSGHVSSPETAVDHLAHMGADGRAALQRLHANQAVTNSRARERLEWLAKNNFRPIR